MIHQDKLKIMARMAVYDKKKGKKDFLVYHYEKKDYVLLQVTKTVLATIFAFAILCGFVVLWNLDSVISHFDTYDYKKIAFAAAFVLIIMLIGFIFGTIKRSKVRYEQAKPAVRRYLRNIDELKAIYEEKEKLQEEFEKGERYDG